MGEQQQRSFLVRSTIPSDEISLARLRADNLDVGFGKAGRLQTRSHCLRGSCCAAGGIGGVDFDEFLVNIAREWAVRTVLREASQEEADKETKNHCADFPPKSTSSGSSSISAAASYGKCV